jgi:MoxR-like ATPase
MPLQVSGIPRTVYELPLLKSIVKLGGAVKLGEKLYDTVAEVMGFAGMEMEYDPVRGRYKWRYDLPWVATKLREQGEMDGSKRGIWKITEKGRQRVHFEWDSFKNSFNLEDYISEISSSDVEKAKESLKDERVDEEVLEELVARFVPETLEAVKGQILIEDTPIHQIITIINANRHLILTGQPGTGKTTVAINTSDQAVKTKFISGYILTTATSDWTTFDTIGGYMPQPDRELIFTPGIVLRAIRENKWLIIDEINRADVDKAFGQLLTILSGQEVELPFYNSHGKPIKLCHARGLSSYYDEKSATYLVGDNWRIIGTMNTYDKNSLFSLSYAFMRRFGFVHINNPFTAQLYNIIDGRVQDGHLNATDANKIKRLLSITPRKLGAAIIIDILNYIKERNSSEAFFESFVAYVIPQLEGLAVEVIVDFFDKTASDLGDKEHQLQIKQYLTELFEIESGAWELN